MWWMVKLRIYCMFWGKVWYLYNGSMWLVWLGRWLGSVLQEHLQTIILNGTLHFLHLEESYHVGLHLKTKPNTTKPHLGFRLTPFLFSFQARTLESKCRDCDNDKQTTWPIKKLEWRFGKTPISSPCLLEERDFGGEIFMVWFYSVFWEQQPSILKADTALSDFISYWNAKLLSHS